MLHHNRVSEKNEAKQHFSVSNKTLRASPARPALAAHATVSEKLENSLSKFHFYPLCKEQTSLTSLSPFMSGNRFHECACTMFQESFTLYDENNFTFIYETGGQYVQVFLLETKREDLYNK